MIYVVEMRATHPDSLAKDWQPQGYVLLSEQQARDALKRLQTDKRRTNIEFRIQTYEKII